MTTRTTSCQMPEPCPAKESLTKKKAMERPFFGRDSCEETKTKKTLPKSNGAFTGLLPHTPHTPKTRPTTRCANASAHGHARMYAHTRNWPKKGQKGQKVVPTGMLDFLSFRPFWTDFMTMTRAWTLEMTEDWTHPRITEHDKACVLQSTVEHNVASEHFNSSFQILSKKTESLNPRWCYWKVYF